MWEIYPFGINYKRNWCFNTKIKATNILFWGLLQMSLRKIPGVFDVSQRPSVKIVLSWIKQFFEGLKDQKKKNYLKYLYWFLKWLRLSVFSSSGKHNVIERYSLVFNSSSFKTLAFWCISLHSFSFPVNFVSTGTVPEGAVSPGRWRFLKRIRIEKAGI